jgi:hypothetical protein
VIPGTGAAVECSLRRFNRIAIFLSQEARTERSLFDLRDMTGSIIP